VLSFLDSSFPPHESPSLFFLFPRGVCFYYRLVMPITFLLHGLKKSVRFPEWNSMIRFYRGISAGLMIHFLLPPVCTCPVVDVLFRGLLSFPMQLTSSAPSGVWFFGAPPPEGRPRTELPSPPSRSWPTASSLFRQFHCFSVYPAPFLN